MKRVIIFSMVVALLLMAFSGVALAGTSPQDIYNDYADNGKLDGTYTDAELQAYLDDATVHQYGDELYDRGARHLGNLDAHRRKPQ